MDIVNLFYELARTHKRINGFMYNKAYEKGAGNAMYPLLWLDDPVSGQAVGPQTNALRWTANFDILGIPDTEADETTVQGEAFTAGLSIIERIKQIKPTTGINMDGFNFISLRDYYDDNAAGYRFTLTLTQANPVNKCADDYDPTKQFPAISALPDFKTDNPEGCAIFNDGAGLPNFQIKI